MLGEGCSSQGIQSKVCLFNHQSLFHHSGNQDTDCLHISAWDPNTSLSKNSSFCLLDSLVAGGAGADPARGSSRISPGTGGSVEGLTGNLNTLEHEVHSTRGWDPLLSVITQEWGERDRKEFFPKELCTSSPLHTQPSKGERKGCGGSRGIQSFPNQGVQSLRHTCCYLLCC